MFLSGGVYLMLKNDIVKKVSNEVVEKSIELMGEKIDRIILYGSYARGDFTSESDIDILILLNCAEKEVIHYRKQIDIIASRIGLENDILVSLMIVDKHLFEDRVKVLNFFQNVQKEGVTLFEQL